MIVGTGPIALETADAYVHDSHLGYDVIAFIDPDAPASSWRELAIGARQPPVQPLDPQSRMLPAREELTEKLSLSLTAISTSSRRCVTCPSTTPGRPGRVRAPRRRQTLLSRGAPRHHRALADQRRNDLDYEERVSLDTWHVRN